MGTLISSDNHWALLAALLAAAIFGFWAEKTNWGKKISGAVATMFFAFLLSNLNIIPPAAPLYGVVWSFLVPIAIPLLLFKTHLGKIFKEAGSLLGAFALGAFGTVLGAVVAFAIVPLGDEGWKLAGVFCATYIGGSINYASTSNALGLQDGSLLSAGAAADNLLMTLFFLILFSLPTFKLIKKIFEFEEEERLNIEPQPSQKEIPDEIRGMKPRNLALSISFSVIICAIGFELEQELSLVSSGILMITAMSVAVGTFLPQWVVRMGNPEALGLVLMQIFFAVLGASAHFMTAIEKGPALFFFAAIILTIHLTVILVGGKLFKMDLRSLLVASNANMGGPTTAAAMASAKGWRHLTAPAILCGTLGYGIGTFIGVGMAGLLR